MSGAPGRAAGDVLRVLTPSLPQTKSTVGHDGLDGLTFANRLFLENVAERHTQLGDGAAPRHAGVDAVTM
jgi:hypothetical protein